MNKQRVLALVATLVFSAPIAAFAQAERDPPVTHGGYGALAGAISLSVLGAIAGGAGRVIYADPLDADCTAEPDRCRRTALEHVLVATIAVAAVTGSVGGGYVGQRLTEKWAWNPVTGWALAGAYLGLPATLLLQNAIPRWEPAWSRDVVGLALGVGGGIGAAFGFSAIARHRGHVWPEFGFGAGGMGLGLTLGTLFAPDTIWVPVLGGLGAVLGASAATLAF